MIQPGDRVLILEPHPHANKTGVYVELRRTIFGMRPVVRFDDGDECFVMKPDDWMAVPKKPAPAKRRRTRIKMVEDL